MAREPSAERIFTVGHSNHSPEFLIDLLARHGVEVVVDVRSSPYARYATHFNREPLEKLLRTGGLARSKPAAQKVLQTSEQSAQTFQHKTLKYLFLGDVLGGRPEGHEFYDDEGHVLYDRLAASPAFAAGVERLLRGVRISSVALLCSEEDPAECHRRLLLGRVLAERGVDVFHIRGDGRLQSEAELAEELLFQKTKGQMTLFDTEEPQQWKSIQSVLPKEPPASFSMPSEEPESDD